MTRPRTSPLLLAVDQLRAERGGRAALERRRDERLRALVAHARAASPFYERLYRGLPSAVPALTDLPPVTKPELMAAFDDWVTDRAVTRSGVERFVADPEAVGAAYLGRYFVGSSSGTTGHPGLFVHDAQARAVYQSFSLRVDRAWLTPRQWLRLARLGGRWAAVVGAGAHFAGAGWMEQQRRRSTWKRHHYRVIPAQLPLAGIVRDLNRFDPAILTGYPSVLELLAEEQQAGRLRIRPVVVELSGESTDDDGRARISAALGPAHDVYAASEFMIIAFGCAEGRLHVNSDWAILEPVDEHHRPTPPGEPSYTVLLTNLANRVQPLVRYDLGDSVVVPTAPCPCGSPLPTVSVTGRRDDVLRFDGGQGRVVSIPPLAIGAVANRAAGVRRIQLVQTSPTRLRVRLDVHPSADPEETWRVVGSRLACYLSEQRLDGVEIVRGQEPPEASPGSGKFRHVIAVPASSGTQKDRS